ncbi:MAG: GNAT family N-acetyltransferase [Christensenella sp.]|nr:GNAT family N-acetyltransferase [Christensenella sp.]
MELEIRAIREEELPQALALVKRVFLQYEAPDYSNQGVDTFLAFLQDRAKVSELKPLGAFAAGQIVGVLAMRGASHISLFFVESAMQGKGVGRALFSAARAACPRDMMTVNSSPYAVEIYKRLGFSPLSTEQEADGIRFTPMKCILISGGDAQ